MIYFSNMICFTRNSSRFRIFCGFFSISFISMLLFIYIFRELMIYFSNMICLTGNLSGFWIFFKIFFKCFSNSQIFITLFIYLYSENRWYAFQIWCDLPKIHSFSGCFSWFFRIYKNFERSFCQGPIVSGHVFISWSNTSNSACYFGDALRCVAFSCSKHGASQSALDIII